MGIFSKQENYFGIDIGTTSIRVVQLRQTGSKPALVAYGDVKVPSGMTTSDSAVDLDKTAAAIRQLVKDAGITTKFAIAGLPSSKVYASVISTPKLSNAELAKAIKFQADQYIPMAIDQVKMDWTVIGGDEKNSEVLLVASPNATANRYTQLFEKAGLELLALEPNSIALSRAVVPPQGPAIILLDISSTSSDLAILHAGAPRLIRSIPVGGNMFIKSVAQNLGLDDEQAQQFTYRFGLTQTKLEGQVFKAIQPSLDSLIGELEKSVKFFNGKYPGVKLEKLVLTGGTSQLPELPTYLANSTSLPVEISNAWINVAYPANLHEQLLTASNQYGVAVGLAERNWIA
jgi:type IV pilus assembly protein PilM